jgi:methyltransferase
MSPDVPSILYVVFVLAALLVAVLERRRASRNERRLLGEGAEDVAPWVFCAMAPVYSLVFPMAIAEHFLLQRRPPAAFVTAMIGVFLLAKGLKAWAIASLGGLWTMRVILPRTLRVVTAGPYRYLRHPNYVAVILEVPALPLVGGAFITAAAATVLFTALLWARVRTEEKALFARPEYARAMQDVRRFVPGGGR